MSTLNAHDANQVTAFLHRCNGIQWFLRKDSQKQQERKKWQKLMWAHVQGGVLVEQQAYTST